MRSDPLPIIDTAFSPLQKAQFFMKLIQIHQGDEWNMLFNTPLGHFKNLLMLFGLTNIPLTSDMLNMFLFVYIDDIVILSETLEEHVQHVQLVLKWLLEKQSFVKAEKKAAISGSSEGACCGSKTAPEVLRLHKPFP